MRGKNYNAGLRGVLFEARHYERMGAAVWLYGWLVLRQTHESGSVGWVLGGAPISYREIEEETGFNRRTLERWMRTLRRGGYIETEAAPEGVIVRITKAKKFAHPPRKAAERFRTLACRAPQNCAEGAPENHSAERVGGGIDSSSVVGFKEREAPNEFSAQNPNPSCVSENQSSRHTPNGRPNFSPEMRARFDRLRAEREEAVRRELAVGSGPEVTRP